MLLFYYCHFTFRNNSGAKHVLVVRVIDLGLEWQLYVNDREVGYFLDEKTNVLIEAQMEQALSFKNVNRVYAELLAGSVADNG